MEKQTVSGGIGGILGPPNDREPIRSSVRCLSRPRLARMAGSASFDRCGQNCQPGRNVKTGLDHDHNTETPQFGRAAEVVLSHQSGMIRVEDVLQRARPCSHQKLMRKVLTVLGVVTVLASEASGEQIRGDLDFSCAAGGQVDAARAAAICAEFVAVLKDQSGFTLRSQKAGPLSAGPGLEIVVTKASDSLLELEPTWVDPAGNRTTLATSGVRAMDTNLTEARRRNLYLNVLANPPT
jgi:hypothetical protein